MASDLITTWISCRLLKDYVHRPDLFILLWRLLFTCFHLQLRANIVIWATNSRATMDPAFPSPTFRQSSSSTDSSFINGPSTAMSISKLCHLYLQNVCQIHQLKNVILLFHYWNPFSMPHHLVPGLLQWFITDFIHCPFRRVIPNEPVHSPSHYSFSFFIALITFWNNLVCLFFCNWIPWWWNSHPEVVAQRILLLSLLHLCE